MKWKSQKQRSFPASLHRPVGWATGRASVPQEPRSSNYKGSLEDMSYLAVFGIKRPVKEIKSSSSVCGFSHLTIGKCILDAFCKCSIVLLALQLITNCMRQIPYVLPGDWRQWLPSPLLNNTRKMFALFFISAKDDTFSFHSFVCPPVTGLGTVNCFQENKIL